MGKHYEEDHAMKMWFWQERNMIALGLHLFRGTLQVAQSEWTDSNVSVSSKRYHSPRQPPGKFSRIAKS